MPVFRTVDNSYVNLAKKGDSEAFDHIVDTLMPTIKKRVNYYAAKSNLPKDILEIDAIVNLQDAVRTFNPDKGNFNTHANSYINKIRRTGMEYANIKHIPEHRILQINTFKTVKDKLTRRFGRHPSSMQLADELGWSVAEVDRIQKELRPELILDGRVKHSPDFTDEQDDMMHYVRYELQPDEQAVYERLTGLVTGTPLSVHETAKDLDKDSAYVYNMKSRLARKIDKIFTRI